MVLTAWQIAGLDEEVNDAFEIRFRVGPELKEEAALTAPRVTMSPQMETIVKS